MGDYRPIKTKLFIKFLEHHNCYRHGEARGSHFYWKRPGLTRRIVIRESDKDIPPFHIKTNLDTLGLSIQDLLDFLDKKSKNKKKSK